MAEAETYTVGDIVRRSGAKERQVLLWADALALWPEGGAQRTGRGVHRRFAWREVEIASVLAATLAFRLPIAVMAGIGSAIRGQLMLRPTSQLDDVAKAFQAARGGVAGVTLVIAPNNDDPTSGDPFSLFVRWGTGAGAPRNKAELVIDLAECWKGLTP